MRKLATLLINLFLVLFFFSAHAQTDERPFMVGMNFGLPQYSGDMGNGFFNLSQPLTSFVGLTVQKTLAAKLDLVLDGSYGTIQIHCRFRVIRFSSEFFQSSLNLKYNF